MLSKKMLNSEIKAEGIKLIDIDRKFLEVDKKAIALKFEI